MGRGQRLRLSSGLMIRAQTVHEGFGSWPPDADVPFMSIPFAVMPLVLQVVGEELWWRDCILPRQELRHGRRAWLVISSSGHSSICSRGGQSLLCC